MNFLRFYMILLALGACAGTSWGAKVLGNSQELTADQIGEFVTLRGRTEDFRRAREKSPHSFKLRDESGALVRVTAWPDIMQTVRNWQALETSGTLVELTAEVTDYEGRLELRIQDGEEVRILPVGSRVGSGETSASVSVTTGISP